MLKLAKHLKAYSLSIIFIIILLFVQAWLNLELPNRMSNIVDIGINRSGIDSAMPIVIRKESLDKLLEFEPNENNKKLIIDSYLELTEQNKDVVSKFPNSLNNQTLFLNNFNLNNIFLNTIGRYVICKENNITDPNADLSKILGVPPEQLPQILSQKTYLFIKSEYEVLGADLSNMQSSYILEEGKIMIIVSIATLIGAIGINILSAQSATAFARDLRAKIFSKVINFNSQEFNKFSVSSLITRSTNDVIQVQMLLLMSFRMLLYAPILGIGAIIKVLTISKVMSPIIFVSLITMLLLIIFIFAFAMPKFKIIQDFVDKINMIIREQLTGVLVIRAFNTQKHEENRLDDTNKNLTNTNLFIAKIMSTMPAFMFLIMNLTTVFIVWFGAKNVDAGNIKVGDIMAIINYTSLILFSFLMITFISTMIPRASVSATRINEILETEIFIIDALEPKKVDDNKKGLIEFLDVSFKYPGADENVLENITFTAEPRKITAFIGSTGSGKSTIVNLIPRFFDTTEGVIKFEGVNIKDLSLKDLRNKIGIVPQKAFLFNGTIESNIKFGSKHIDDEQMIFATKISQSEKFVSEKELKYEDAVSQAGNNLSGGQKQRLSIARAIAKDPNVFIFDDSFSALDYKTDKLLRSAIKEELSDKTILIIAQRISTIKDADTIIVLDEGKIVGVGKHKELLNTNDVYKQIALSQLSAEELLNE